MRGVWRIAAIGAWAAVGCGGGPAAFPVSAGNQGYAQQLLTAVEAQDAAACERHCQQIDQMLESGRAQMTDDERELFDYVCEVCQDGDWEEAEETLRGMLGQ